MLQETGENMTNDDTDVEEKDVDAFCTRHDKPPEERCRRSRACMTLLLCSAAVGLGLCMSVPGPTLIDLRRQVHVSLETVSYIFSGRSAGYLLGSLFGGVLYDHMNHQLFLGLVMTVAATATALIPFASEISLLASSLVVHGIAMGCLDTGGNALCLHLWGKKSGPYMQSLHFAFGIGAVLAPVIVDPLLSQRKAGLSNNGTRHSANFSDIVAEDKWHPPANVTAGIRDEIGVYNTLHWSMRTDNLTFVRRDGDGEDYGDLWTESKIQYAFFAITAYLYLCSVAFFASCFRDISHCTCKRQDQKQIVERSGTALTTHSLCFKIKFLSLLLIFYLLVAGLDIAFGAFITTFAFDVLHWSKEKSANLSTVFWGALAAVRGVSIIVSKFINSAVMIICDLFLLTSSTLAMLFLIKNYELAMWTGTAIFGVGLASLYGAGISWAERYIHISGKISALFSIGGGVGKFIFPPLIGHFFHVNDMSLIYICLSASAANSALFFILFLISRRQGERYLPVAQVGKGAMEPTTTVL